MKLWRWLRWMWSGDVVDWEHERREACERDRKQWVAEVNALHIQRSWKYRHLYPQWFELDAFGRPWDASTREMLLKLDEMEQVRG